MFRGYDPLKEIHRWSLVISLLAGEFFLAGLLVSPFYTNFSFINDTLPFFLVVLLAYALLGITLPLLAIRRNWSEKKQRDPLRKDALNGDSRLLAPIQPSPHAQTLMLPIRIESRLRWHSMWLLIGGAIIFVSSSILGIWTLLGDPGIVPWYFTFLASTGGIIGIQIPMWIALGLRNTIAGHYLLPTLLIDEDGIHARYGCDTISMRWEDVRYFALVSSVTFRGTGQREAFELSDGENMLCWLATEPFSTYSLLWSSGAPSSMQMTLSDRDYASFTQQLSSLIVAKTGKPLYDLRLAKHKKKSRQAHQFPLAPLAR